MPRGGPKADANTRSGSHSGGDHVTTSSDDGGAEAGVGPNAPTSRPSPTAQAIKNRCIDFSVSGETLRQPFCFRWGQSVERGEAKLRWLRLAPLLHEHRR